MAKTTSPQRAGNGVPATPPRENLIRASHGIELQRDSSNALGMPTMSGHFAVFNQWTEINSMWEGNFMERFSPQAFDKTIRESKGSMKVLFNHGQDPQLGSKVLGPIEDLRADSEGVLYAVPMLDTSYCRDLIPGLDAGLYGASFRFRVMQEQYVAKPKVSRYNPTGIPERTVTEASVAEFGPVTFPAYEGASAGLRSLTDVFLFDKLTGDPDRLRELIDAKKSRTITTSSPTTTVTFTSRDGWKGKDPERMDTEDLDCLAQMIQLGADYIAEQDEPDDQPNIPKMEAILASLTELVPVEVAEQEPADEPEDEENAAAPEGATATEPGSSETTTQRTEPERPVATTRANETPNRAGLYIPKRKGTPTWHL